MERGRPQPGPGIEATRRILWGSFLFSLLVYGGLGYTVLAGAAAESAFPEWLWPLVAAVFALAAILLPRALGDRLPPRGEDTALVRPPEMLGWALAEAVGIIGLVSVTLGGPTEPLVLYLLAAAALLWIHRP